MTCASRLKQQPRRIRTNENLDKLPGVWFDEVKKHYAPTEDAMTEQDLTEKLGFTRHAKATWTMVSLRNPVFGTSQDITEVMIIEEVGEDWVTARPEGSDTLYTFGNHPQADVKDLGSLVLLPKEDA